MHILTRHAHLGAPTNHANFFVGDQNVNSASFGKITSQFYTPAGVGPRVIQFGLYYKF